MGGSAALYWDTLALLSILLRNTLPAQNVRMRTLFIHCFESLFAACATATFPSTLAGYYPTIRGHTGLPTSHGNGIIIRHPSSCQGFYMTAFGLKILPMNMS